MSELRSGWQVVGQVGIGNHGCLERDDVCLYYRTREHHSKNEPAGRGYSDAYSTITNFKRTPSQCAARPDFAQYKEEATRRISDDLARLMMTSRVPGARFALVPALTSRMRGDAEYDDRLADVCARVAARVQYVDCLDVLSVDQNLQKSRSGARLGVADILPHVLVNTGRPLASYDYVYVFDDVLTTGAHFKACQAALMSVYGIPKPGGLFWARSESPSERS